jgi:5-formyltetrahydrofolate cyclo-ligase
VSAGADAARAKAEQRTALQAWRLGLDLADVRRWSGAIAARLLEWPRLSSARTVLAYAALRREPQTDEIIAALQARGVGVALPEVRGADLVPRWAAPGASRDPEAIDPEAIDAALVPGLAFDAAGRRLGRGGGHYDRFLPRLRPDCLRVGLCFEGQRLAALPTECWDESVDAVVTEAGIWEVAGRA